jgi:poly(A) polymerase
MSCLDENITALIEQVALSLKKHRKKGYLVGGFVRDLLLDRETNDIDIAVKGDARKIAEKMAAELDGKYVLLDDINQVARVVLKQQRRQFYLDFSSFDDTIEKDLNRRDFTIDAMALNINKIDVRNLIDPLGGLEDLLNATIRAVKKDVFKSDPSRLMRGIRFKYAFNLNIEPETEALIKKHAGLAGKVPGEKTRLELLALLSLPQAYDALRYMDELGLLSAIIPEIDRLKGVEQPKEHFWDVFNHSLEAVACACLVLREKKWKYDPSALLPGFTPWSETIQKHFDKHVARDSNHRQLFKLAALLHDISKPACKTFDETTGRTRFLGHARDGSEVAAAILERLRFGSKEIKAMEIMVYNHLRPAQMSNTNMPTKRAVYRFFRDTGEFGLDVLFLELADFLASQGPKLRIGDWTAHTDLAKFVIQSYEEQSTAAEASRLLDGNDLIKVFGLKPGPQIGKILAALDEAQTTGKIKTRAAAVALVKKKLGKTSPRR